MSRFISLSSTIRTLAMFSSRRHGARRRLRRGSADHEHAVALDVALDRDAAADELREFETQGERDAYRAIFGGAVVRTVGEDVEQRIGAQAVIVELRIAQADLDLVAVHQ